MIPNPGLDIGYGIVKHLCILVYLARFMCIIQCKQNTALLTIDQMMATWKMKEAIEAENPDGAKLPKPMTSVEKVRE